MSDARPLPFFVKRMAAVLDTLAFVCRILTGVALVFLTVIFGWLVFGRYVLNATPTWVEQMALLLVMLIAFLGAAVGVHENTHLSVSLLRSAVPPRVRSFFVVLSDVLMAGFGGLMLWYGAQLTIFKWGSLIPLIQLPEGLRSLPLTIGGGLILIFSVGHLIRLFLGVDDRSDSIE
ncbi:MULTISPECIES: TRAP transporter small permease [Roseobacter]|uniref:TRAP transporter small permease protein n=1 Tax=Roseobacter litoralis (strain ATCC 49566 / DSM 6996 / JCM 21268 / NBRC 15278 / OCh 149) TaxID=391595 RepID=F7ZIF4_ROSLO|nr:MULTISPECIES: TRAP transporter small permease [Roseobacter]AEI92473.1 putative TRAP transporter subunit DctQ [Roseobacter litoralis Och 149]GIT87660.1 C4-dicarboxylate ABC transporter permease [Roseobacter sp. OBYS 0001]